MKRVVDVQLAVRRDEVNQAALRAEEAEVRRRKAARSCRQRAAA